jgi:hypothetical protein
MDNEYNIVYTLTSKKIKRLMKPYCIVGTMQNESKYNDNKYNEKNVITIAHHCDNVLFVLQCTDDVFL